MMEDLYICIPSHLKLRISQLAEQRNCTIVDILDAIVETLEYRPESIWRAEDAVETSEKHEYSYNTKDQILEYLEKHGASGIKEIAAALDKHPQGVQFHLWTFIKAGIVARKVGALNRSGAKIYHYELVEK